MPPPVRLAYREPAFDPERVVVRKGLDQLRAFLLGRGFDASDHDLFLAYADWCDGWSRVPDLVEAPPDYLDKLLAGLLARLKPVEG